MIRFEGNLSPNKTIKRYFVTKTLKTDLPYDFIHSKNQRYVHVLSCKFVQKIDGQTIVPAHISLHADFVQDKNYEDSFVRFCNEYNDRDKYEQLNQNECLTVWFKHINGTDVDMTNAYFVLKLMLEY